MQYLADIKSLAWPPFILEIFSQGSKIIMDFIDEAMIVNMVLLYHDYVEHFS